MLTEVPNTKPIRVGKGQANQSRERAGQSEVKGPKVAVLLRTCPFQNVKVIVLLACSQLKLVN